MQPIEFRAPWSRPLRVVTVMVSLVLLATSAFGMVMLGRITSQATMLVLLIPLLILLVAIPFGVRGYVLTESSIIVRRVGWSTSLPLAGLQSVSGNANAMRGSLRLFGNGGLFAFSGEFWNRQLGRYRALATDPSRAVVLRYPKRIVVITPHDPQQFIMRARTLLSTAKFPGG